MKRTDVKGIPVTRGTASDNDIVTMTGAEYDEMAALLTMSGQASKHFLNVLAGVEQFHAKAKEAGMP